MQSLIAELPRTFWLLWWGTIINRLGGFVTPFLALYLTGPRGLSVAQAGMIVSLYGIGNFAAALIGGTLSDRVGRKPVLMTSFLVSPLFMVALGLSRAYVAIIPCTLMLGLLQNLYRPAMSAAVADVVPESRRVRAYGLIYWAINVGAAVAPIVAGLVARANFLLLFIGDATTTLAFGIIVSTAVPETSSSHANTTSGPAGAVPERGPRAVRQRGALLAEPLVLLFCVLSLMTGSVYAQSYSTLPVAMGSHGLTTAQYGAAIALNGILIVILGVPATRISERLARFPTMAVAATLLGIGFGMTALMHSLSGYALSIAIWTLGEIAASSIGPAIVADLSPRTVRGFYQGLYSSSWGLAWFIGPIVGGAVYEHLGRPALWTGCLAVCVAAAGGQLLLGRAARNRSVDAR